jgi:hypothetical protein
MTKMKKQPIPFYLLKTKTTFPNYQRIKTSITLPYTPWPGEGQCYLSRAALSSELPSVFVATPT